MMIVSTEIITSAKAVILEAFENAVIYEEYQPKNFIRPSFFLTLGGGVYTPDIGGMADVRQELEIVAFVQADEYHNSHFAELALREAQIMGAFSTGYIRVGDRALHITDISVNRFFDSRQLIIALEYKDDISAAKPEPPTMKNLKMRVEV